MGTEDGEQAIELFVNVNKFAAQLFHTDRMFASYDWWALVVMREALEYPADTPDRPKPDALIPAALAWLSILGPEIYTWDKEFPSSHAQGDPGKGGPLWGGQHGFCEERWYLWKRRFEEVSSSNDLSEHLRKLATECVAKMTVAENQ